MGSEGESSREGERGYWSWRTRRGKCGSISPQLEAGLERKLFLLLGLMGELSPCTNRCDDDAVFEVSSGSTLGCSGRPGRAVAEGLLLGALAQSLIEDASSEAEEGDAREDVVDEEDRACWS